MSDWKNIMARIAGYVEYALLNRNGNKLQRLRDLAFTVSYEKVRDEDDFVTGYMALIYDQNGFIVEIGKGINRNKAFDKAYAKWLEKLETRYGKKQTADAD